MSQTVWIINQYGSLPSTGLGGRHRHFARELSKLGYNVSLISGRWTHGTRNEDVALNAPELEHFEGFKFLRLSAIKYKHAHDKKRIFNWFWFAFQMLSISKKLNEKPDVIFYSSPSLIGLLAATFLAKKYKAKLVFEVRDIWPLTFVQLGGFSPKHPFIMFLQWIEDKAYRDADAVVSNLKNSVDHMIGRGMDPKKFTWIPNGFSLDEANQVSALSLQTANQLPRNKFIVGYTGTFGLANALDTLVLAADRLKEYTDIAFVLVGSGKEKPGLNKLVNEKGLNNVFFIQPIPKVEIQAMLSNFSVCYIGLTKDPLFKFGVSPNKLFDYLYSGQPIIYGIDSGDYNPISDAGAGLQIPAQDADKLAAAVLQLYHMLPAERFKMGENGRKLALEQYEFGQLAGKLAGVLFTK